MSAAVRELAGESEAESFGSTADVAVLQQYSAWERDEDGTEVGGTLAAGLKLSTLEKIPIAYVDTSKSTITNAAETGEEDTNDATDS